jgi:hypothetical protein
MNDALDELGELKTRKPLFIFEFGVTGGHLGCDAPSAECDPAQCDAAEWADDALELLLSRRWPEARGFSWWNELWGDKEDGKGYVTNMRVQTVPNLKEKFQRRLQGSSAVSCPAYERVEARRPQQRLLVPAYFNPGMGCNERYLTEAKADLLCLYESPETRDPGGAKPFRDYTRRRG